MYKTSILILICLASTGAGSTAQDIRGVWEGYITAEGVYNRGVLLDVKTQTKEIVSGRSYLFDIVKAGSSVPGTLRATMDFIGRLDKQSSLSISDLRILNSRVPDEETFLWIKKSSLVFRREGSAEILAGSWRSAINSKSPYNTGNIIVRRRPGGLRDTSYRITEEVLKEVEKDSLPEISFLQTELANPIILDVKNYKIKVTIRDYMKEDLDTVSVFFNRKKIINRRRIVKRPFSKTVLLDKYSSVSEIVVYAENLGLVPPNTCTMIVDDGLTKQKVSITSDKQTSAAVYLNYVPALVDD